MHRRSLLIALFVNAAVFGALAATPEVPEPAVRVSYRNPEAFIDAGDEGGPSERILAALTRHLQALGTRWLPAGQRLSIEVFQIDLAGRVEPAIRQPQRLRVIRGSDWPRIDLRYTLTTPDGSTERREESLTDPSFQLHPIKGRDEGEPLRYEKRMLAQWFEKRFAPHAESPAKP